MVKVKGRTLYWVQRRNKAGGYVNVDYSYTTKAEAKKVLKKYKKMYPKERFVITSYTLGSKK